MRVLTHAIVTIVTVFLLTLISSVPAFAADPARWNGDKILYEGFTHDQRTADGTKPPRLANNQIYYVAGTTPDLLGNGAQARVIYFDSGITLDRTDSANLLVFSLDSGGNYGNVVSGPTKIALVPKVLSPSNTQAGWTGDSLTYNGMNFTGSGGSPRIASGNGPPAGSQYYSNASNPGLDGRGTLRVLYFPAGVNVKEATTATYAEYVIEANGTIGQQTAANQTVTVVPATVADGGNVNPDGSSATSCNVEGIGWIVCPVTNFLAWAMDRIFDLIAGYLEVTPLSTDTSSSLYQAWNIIRSIANIAFVIAFLIIIFSQITSVGLTNYSVKKLLPRLIITAVLVNLSYFIAAIAVDLSNIAGYSVQSIFVSLREQIEMANPNRIVTWESVTGYILTATAAGTAAAVTIGGIVISSGASLSAALVLLLPMLVGLIIAVLVALVVLAARQALIIILIVLAPLAFVAFLLPNTEKLFDKWRSIFVTMLVFFPLFALIFGGSQLAAQIIIQTASGDNAINIILLAMFVQVAPLVLTPLLVRFSGSIIGRIAGFVNDPGKGLIDRTRTWSKSQSEYLAARNMARRDPVRSRQVFRRFALSMDERKRQQDARLASYKEAADARWTNSQGFSDIQQDMRYNQELKTTGEERASLRFEESRTGSARVRQLDLNARQVRAQLDNAKVSADIQWDSNRSNMVAQERLRSRVLKDQLNTIHSSHDAEFEEFKAGRASAGTPVSAAVSAMMRQSQNDTRLMAMNAMRAESAKRQVNEELTAALKQNTQRIDGQLLQTYAGGIQNVSGAQRALAAAIAAQDKASAEAQSNALTILADANLGDNIVTKIALGQNAGTSIIITEDMRKAATAKIAGGANATEILNLMTELDLNPSAGNQDIRQIFHDELIKNPNKPKFAGAGILAEAKQGLAPLSGKARIDEWIALTINSDKLSSAEVLVTQDKDYLTAIRDTLRNNLSSIPISSQAKANIRQALAMARRTPQYAGKIAERRGILEDIERYL